MDQVLAMLGFLVMGASTDVANLCFASLIVLCWFSSIHFKEASQLKFSEVTIQLSGSLLFHFPSGPAGTRALDRMVEFKPNHFRECQMGPVDILK